MTRLFVRGLTTICGIAFALSAAAGTAPIPKDAGKAAEVPDLKALLTSIGNAVEKEKWPAEADEKLLREAVDKVFNKALAAAEQKERKLPIDIDKLRKVDVTKGYKVTGLKDAFLIAGDVEITGVQNSVIFASGNVRVTSATNSVIVAKNLRCTSLRESVVIAGESIQATGIIDRDTAGSVIVAGQKIKATVLQNVVCHVVRPDDKPPPDKEPLLLVKPISSNRSTNVYFLNVMEDTRTGNENCKFLPLKTPIAK
jgi:hypothetical protein